MAPEVAVVIGTARGVVVAVILAIVLAALAIADRARAPAIPADRALVPHFAADRLAWDGGETLVRDPKGWRATSGAALDPDAIDALITTLRGARWQRIAARETAGPVGPALHVGDRTTLAVGQPLAGTDQVWIVRGDDTALLVDGWVARAIAMQPWQLHLRRPFAAAGESDVTLVEGGRTLQLVGHPPKYDHHWVDPLLSAQLDDALRSIEIVGPGTGGTVSPNAQSITVIRGADKATLAELGPCAGHPDWVAVTGIVGGCVAAYPWRMVQTTSRVIDSDEGIDLRPLPIAATGIHFPDGDLDLGKQPSVTIDHVKTAVEPSAMTELIGALSARGERAAVPTGAPHTLVVHTARGDLALAAYAPDVVVRTDDQVAIRVGTAAYAILARGARAYRQRTLWAEDPTTITRVAYHGGALYRGTVLGEWTLATDDGRRPLAHGPAIEAYVAHLARIRALDADPPASFAIVDHVSFDVASPDGRHETHALELGAPIAAGCPARIGGAPVVVDRALCTPPKF